MMGTEYFIKQNTMQETSAKHIQEIEQLKNQWLYADAKIKVQNYLLQHTDDYRLYEELADIALYEGDLDQAESSLAIAQRLNPESATGMYLMGFIHISKGNFRLWVELLEKANELFPNNPEILRNLWWWYAMLGNPRKGIAVLKRALNLAPDDTLIMEDLGVTLISEGDIEEWQSMLKRAGKESRLEELKTMMGM